MTADVLIIGAGVSGLSCARALARAGKSVRVLERSRGVGGRCATRRIDGQPVDHGVAFLHGRSPGFLEAVRAVRATRIEGWPSIVRGEGTPCQPRAFDPRESRVALREGISMFPKSLATGLDVTLDVNVTALQLDAAFGITVHADQCGEALMFRARDVVLALAGPQTEALLSTLPDCRPAETARALLALLPSFPCATLIAVYERSAGVPPWHMWYPESSSSVLLVAHDSSKRADPEHTVLVVQARPAWSRVELGRGESEWAALLLHDAAQLLGPWADRPITLSAQRWRHARVGAESELAAPLVLDLPRGCRIGVAGELCAPGGGVEAAWRSGEELARRLLDEV
ncbi:MAG TPA: FAD-dependent oxidoreductase [Polyangiales bacterium]